MVTQIHGRERGEAKFRQMEMMHRKTALFRITILFFITNISICYMIT
jgi:hypothetical protein